MKQEGLFQRIFCAVLFTTLPVVPFAFSVAIPSQVQAEDWVQFRHDSANSGRSAETGISSSNVSSLKQKWQMSVPGGTASTPAVVTVNGTSTVFIPSLSGSIYTFNAVTGAAGWHVALPAPVTAINSSPTVVNGILYVGANDGRLHAVNATTGAHLWSYPPSPQASSEVYSSPVVNNGVVYFGIASVDDDNVCVAGHAVAVNATSGTMVWDTSMAPSHTGAGVWTSPAIDLTNSVVFVGTGNAGGRCSAPSLVPLADSIVAVNLTTGKVSNSFQAIPNDNGDLDFGSSPVLTTVTQWNQCTGSNVTDNYVLDASKNGTLYSVQRVAGGILSGSGFGLNLTNPASYIFQFGSPGLSGEIVTSVGCGGVNRIITTSQKSVLGATVPNNPAGSAPLFGISEGIGSLSPSWSLNQSFGSYTSPVTISDLAIYGGGDNKLHAYLWSTGQSVFTYTPAAPGPLDGSVAISNGRVYFGATNGFIYCLSINGL
jgi:outer membrane protein assembly factor BamB